MPDLIPCADLREFDELHALMRKALGIPYPRACGADPADFRGKGRHVVVVVTAHVAPVTDEKTGKVSAPVTGEFLAALVADDLRSPASRLLSAPERARLATALLSASPAPAPLDPKDPP